MSDPPDRHRTGARQQCSASRTGFPCRKTSWLVQLVQRVAEGTCQRRARCSVNPLFLHGPSGTGKSHLVSALIVQATWPRSRSGGGAGGGGPDRGRQPGRGGWFIRRPARGPGDCRGPAAPVGTRDRAAGPADRSLPVPAAATGGDGHGRARRADRPAGPIADQSAGQRAGGWLAAPGAGKPAPVPVRPGPSPQPEGTRAGPWPQLVLDVDGAEAVACRRARGSRGCPSSVFAQTTATPARLPFVIHIFVPLSTQPSPSRRADVRIAAGSLPASGSVRPKQPITSPAAIGSSQRCFCSSEPKRVDREHRQRALHRDEAAQAAVARLELQAREPVGGRARAGAAVALAGACRAARARRARRRARPAARPRARRRRRSAGSAAAPSRARSRRSAAPRSECRRRARTGHRPSSVIVYAGPPSSAAIFNRDRAAAPARAAQPGAHRARRRRRAPAARGGRRPASRRARSGWRPGATPPAISTIEPSPSRCASANASRTSLTGPARARRRRSARARARPRVRARTAARAPPTSASRCSTRAGLVAKRASAASAAQPSAAAERLELAVVADRDDDLAVGRRERLVRRDARVAVAHPRRGPPRRRGSPDAWLTSAGEQRAHQRDLGALPEAAALALAQRREDRRPPRTGRRSRRPARRRPSSAGRRPRR